LYPSGRIALRLMLWQFIFFWYLLEKNAVSLKASDTANS
jgi:hypothetical protein